MTIKRVGCCVITLILGKKVSEMVIKSRMEYMRTPLHSVHMSNECKHQARHKTALQQNACAGEMVAHKLAGVCPLQINRHGGLWHDALVVSSEPR